MARRVSTLWIDQLGDLPVRPPLPGDLSADVVVVGAGFTGLWTAYYLSRLAPDTSVVVVDAHRVGFGASGRNGGWCMASMAAGRERWARLAGEEGAGRMDDAIAGIVDEIERVVVEEGIACDWAKGGSIELARNRGQVTRLKRHAGGGLVWLDADQAAGMCGATRVLGGLYDAATAAIQPAKLVTGLAAACERAGVTIFEDTPVTSIEGRRLRTRHGTIDAQAVVVATEAYTQTIEGHARRLAPFYSLMIATEPLTPELLDIVRLHDRPTFADARYRVIYGQRTADGRLAFGSPGPSYRFGSSIDPTVEQDERWHTRIHEILLDLFPCLEGTAVTHRWGGVLGVPRNWTPTVSADTEQGRFYAGGYVGEGVGVSNLAGRCVAHLVAGTGDPLTTLPWVRPPSRRWPVEPLRWVGIRAGAKLLEISDRREERSGRPAREAELVWRVLRR